MADEKQPSGGSNFIVLAAAMVSAAYFIWQQPHLQGFRPVETLPQAHDDRGKQDVEARFWQDPLAAVQGQYEQLKNRKTAGDDHSIDNAREYLEKSRVIGVMLPGGPYSEDSEARRRYRYAVLAALHTAKYDPKDENHLGYFQTTPHQPQDSIVQVWDGNVDLELKLKVKLSNEKQKQSPIPEFIPFEQFTKRESKADLISILWLNEDVLNANQRPIASIRSLLSQLNLSRPISAIIGPQYSDTLINMLNEIKKSSVNSTPFLPVQNGNTSSLKECLAFQADSAPAENPSPIYNYGATAEENILLTSARLPSACDGKNRTELFKMAKIDYHITASTDNDLAPVLVAELKKRIKDLRKPNANSDHVVLISEADTFYGRSLHKTIKHELSL